MVNGVWCTVNNKKVSILYKVERENTNTNNITNNNNTNLLLEHLRA